MVSQKYKSFFLLLFLCTEFIDARRPATKKPIKKKQTIENVTPAAEKKSPVIIFDLTNVLFKENQIGFAQKIGYATLANYAITHWKNPGYRCLDMLHVMSTKDTQKPNYCITLKGRVLPHCLVELQAGNKTCVQVKEEINQAIEQLHKAGYFSSIKEKNLMLSIMNIILDPETVTTIIEPIKPMIALVQKLKATGHQLYLCANAPQELFAALQKKYPEIIALFDGVVISSHIKKVKPDPGVFQHLTATHNLNPQEQMIIIIDDLESSVAACKQLAIEGIVYDKMSTVTQKLKDFGVTV
jgi:HAD superfamily hydrolase (TIGR01509 family)